MIQTLRSDWFGAAMARPFLIYGLATLAQVWLGCGRLALSVSKAMMIAAKVGVGDAAEFENASIGHD